MEREPHIFNDINQLADAIRAKIVEPMIVGIDGWTGAGKTTLGRNLVAITGGDVFDIDEALNRDLECYVQALRMPEIYEKLSNVTGIQYVTGICLREVFEKASIIANAHIYIKRMATWGWADEDELTGIGLPDSPQTSGFALRDEMRNYHHLWEPHLRANFQFHRFD